MGKKCQKTAGGIFDSHCSAETVFVNYTRQCPSTLQGQLQRTEQRLKHERLRCEEDKSRAERRILTQAAQTRVSETPP